jgi:transcriptional regulator of aromatic amino acid metabolism
VPLQTLRRVHEEMESVHNVRIKPARDGKRTLLMQKRIVRADSFIFCHVSA